MTTLSPLLGLILQSATDLPQLPLGRLEQVSMVALLMTICVILWRAYQEKDRQLQDLIKKIIESDAKQLSVMERVEHLLDSLRR
jgi:hypothetical protein